MQTEELTITEHPIYVGVPMMDESEARAVVTRIKTRIDIARGELLELHDREGWRALGYRNWETCAKEEFGHSAAQMYRLLSAAQIERAIDSPIGEYPESHLREVARLDTPDQQKLALDQARERTNGKPTAKDVRQAAAEIARPDLPLEYAVIQRRYASRGHVLSAAWDGAVQRFVVRAEKEGSAGAVMLWPAVLDRLERLEAEPPPPAAPAGWVCEQCGARITDMRKPTNPVCTQCAIQRQTDRLRPASATVSAYNQQEQADIKLMRAAHDAIEAGDYAGARALLDQVQRATYERDMVLRTLVRTEATRFYTEQVERLPRFSPQAMISLTSWKQALAHIAALLDQAA